MKQYGLTSACVAFLLSAEAMSQQAAPEPFLPVIPANPNGVDVPPKAIPIDGAVVQPITPAGNGLEGKSSTALNKQFIVEGKSTTLNKSVSALCSKLAAGVHKLLGEKQPDKGFYVINVYLYSEGNAPRVNLFKNTVTPLEGGGYRVNLVVDIREQIDRSVLESGIMQAIIIERTLQKHPELDEGSKIEVPRWLSDGLLGAIKWNEGDRSRGMFEVLNRKPDLFLVERLFKTTQKDIESMGQTLSSLYRASSTAMVMAVLRQPDGKAGMKNLLSEVAIFEGDPTELLRKNIPALNVGTKGLIKLWNLQLAEMAAPRIQDIRTLIKTEEELRGILYFGLVGPDRIERRVGMKDFDVLLGLDKKERVRTCVLLNQRLVQLSYRAFPDYQPILAEYGFILSDIIQGKEEGVAERLQLLEVDRAKMYASGKRVRDVLDWYRISQARGLEGDFSGYQRLLEEMKSEKTIEQSNDISDYVNKIESLMTR